MQIESLPTNQRKREWHPIVNGKVGTIVGLPSFNGQIVASDGILCQIMTAHGHIVEGHLQFFEEATDASNASTKTTIRHKPPKALAAYC